MTPEQIDLVKTSFSKVAPISETAAELFYGRLFEIAPSVKNMFPEDLKEQGKKLMMSISVVVNGLTDLEKVVPIAEDLAKKHVDYGVKAEHYESVGASLIWTLGQGLGDDFTDEVKEAWVEAYTLLSNVMISAAYPSNEAAE